jgi:two-component system sensor histidine kinase KdpD
MDLKPNQNRMLPTQGLRRALVILVRGVALVAAVTAICYRIQLNSASTALIFLIAIVLQSLDCDFWEAAIVCVLATASLDWFFIEPLFTFRVAHGLDAVTLVCLLIVSLVVTRIQARSRSEARESSLQRENMERLYLASTELYAQSPSVTPGPALLRPFWTRFKLDAVCLFDQAAMELHEVGTSRGELAAKTRDGYISGSNAMYPELEIVVQCLRERDTVLGAIGFEGLRNPELLAPTLAGLAASALERSRIFRSAATAAANAQAETLRSAILDALAHEFKTPLATIVTAAGGLSATGPMSSDQAELAGMIESEAARLGELTTRLLRLARLDREEVKPRLEPSDAAELAQQSVRRYVKLWPDRQISFVGNGTSGEVRVDPELMSLAINQLIENACKYSRADARVVVELSAGENAAAIDVWNDGDPIPPHERRRIFDRFFRGTSAQRAAAGSGLGLYVARKIALAHGGDLSLTDGRADGVTFRLTLPLKRSEASVAE